MIASGSYQPGPHQSGLDGLRAVAVLGVLLVHFGVAWLPGGFVGVDIFFVLSGYLITRVIVREIATTSVLSFRDFYLRRFRRLFPALVCTVAVTFVLAALLLSPVQFASFAASVVAAVTSTSNFLFWSQADYFDALASTKPLLHTWSLSVEEQFYLLWPLALFLGARYLGLARTGIGLAVVSRASLALSHYWLLSGSSEAAFYILPSRVFELGIGAILVWLPVARPGWITNGLALVGFVVIAASFAGYQPDMPFPGLMAVPPCLATAFIIYAEGSPAANVLRVGTDGVDREDQLFPLPRSLALVSALADLHLSAAGGDRADRVEHAGICPCCSPILFRGTTLPARFSGPSHNCFIRRRCNRGCCHRADRHRHRLGMAHSKR